MLQLYGTRNSRAFRCLWMLEECGVEYTLETIDFAAIRTEHPDYLTVNPNGKVPALVDGELILFESLAINLHLAKRYAPQFWPDSADDESRLYQWLAWAMGELEGPHDAANRTSTPLDQHAAHRSLEALRLVLRAQPYMLGQTFTVADLNTVSVLLRPQLRGIVRADAELADWFQRCTSRPALERALPPKR